MLTPDHRPPTTDQQLRRSGLSVSLLCCLAIRSSRQVEEGRRNKDPPTQPTWTADSHGSPTQDGPVGGHRSLPGSGAWAFDDSSVLPISLLLLLPPLVLDWGRAWALMPLVVMVELGWAGREIAGLSTPSRSVRALISIPLLGREATVQFKLGHTPPSASRDGASHFTRCYANEATRRGSSTAR
ncbi:hypothetical protein MAPG_09209 [Magnaporthiopsis poae ATCC 64411]|uniref:Uncharacterized protein n=1 Tax=Magnaporthiopsis poae (strain ATCC 64411 / 73-15) TaxID=644358 RepID=A0A0C4E9C9_MAGP6|nr:hypothetical protein MAPG_09209 [Magnaporthiopsis poae ATCC 64411]